MKDMMMEIYNALIADETISTKVGKSGIKFFEVPETYDTTKPFVIIDALANIQSAYFSSDKEISVQVSYQINVESTNRMLTKEIAKAVKDVMWSLKFGQLTGGLDEYFAETKRFVDARRYRKNTNIYDTDY